MAKYLKSIYNDRLHVEYGDSMEVLPEFHRKYPDLKCDVILVDGGHEDKVPWTDIHNFATMFAIPGVSLMVFDDFPARWGIYDRERAQNAVLGQAWQMAQHYKVVKELMKCTYEGALFKKWERGFAVGIVTSSRPIPIIW